MAATIQAPPIQTTLCHMALRLNREPSSFTPHILSWAVALNRVMHFWVQHGQHATHSLFGQLGDGFHLLAVKPARRQV
jgi:hypothetical protein